jgi:hypothetical protein
VNEQSKIWQPYERGDGVTASGTGLGLSIAKMFVEEMGGKLSLTSVVDVGTKFSFTLAFEACAEPCYSIPITTESHRSSLGSVMGAFELTIDGATVETVGGALRTGNLVPSPHEQSTGIMVPRFSRMAASDVGKSITAGAPPESSPMLRKEWETCLVHFVV